MHMLMLTRREPCIELQNYCVHVVKMSSYNSSATYFCPYSTKLHSGEFYSDTCAPKIWIYCPTHVACSTMC